MITEADLIFLGFEKTTDGDFEFYVKYYPGLPALISTYLGLSRIGVDISGSEITVYSRDVLIELDLVFTKISRGFSHMPISITTSTEPLWTKTIVQ